MKTLEAAARVIRRWNVSSLANLPADSGITLLDAFNGAIEEFYSLAPSIFREMTISEDLVAPSAVSIGVTKGSNDFTGFSPGPAQLLATIRITTDGIDNRIAGATTLQDSFQGSTGTQPATVYGDSIPMDTIEALLDEPALMGFDFRLKRNDEYAGSPALPFRREAAPFVGYRGTGRPRSVGLPRSYWIEPNALAQEGSPSSVLRVDPMPDILYRLRVRALVYPSRMILSDLQTNAMLPLRDAWIETMFLPLVLERMSEHELWKDKSTIDRTVRNAETARIRIQRIRPEMAKPRNRCGTPKGF